MKNIPKIQEEMAQLQTRIPQITGDGDRGPAVWSKPGQHGRNEILA